MKRSLTSGSRWTCAFLFMIACAAAQPEVSVETPPSKIGWLTRPYQSRSVPPIRLSNSSRLDWLLRANILYLTADDVVALSVENNIDVEVQRYAPLLAQEVLKRALAGGALRSVGSPVAAGPVSVSLQGVSLNASGTGGNAGGVSSGGGIVTQLGPVIPSLDPTVSALVNFQHSTIPQSNTVLLGTAALIQDLRTVQAQYAQSWDF